MQCNKNYISTWDGRQMWNILFFGKKFQFGIFAAFSRAEFKWRAQSVDVNAVSVVVDVVVAAVVVVDHLLSFDVLHVIKSCCAVSLKHSEMMTLLEISGFGRLRRHLSPDHHHPAVGLQIRGVFLLKKMFRLKPKWVASAVAQLEAVWPDKIRQMSIKVAQRWIHWKNEWFWHLYKNCLTMWVIWVK